MRHTCIYSAKHTRILSRDNTYGTRARVKRLRPTRGCVQRWSSRALRPHCPSPRPPRPHRRARRHALARPPRADRTSPVGPCRPAAAPPPRHRQSLSARHRVSSSAAPLGAARGAPPEPPPGGRLPTRWNGAARRFRAAAAEPRAR
eukprot:863427-Prymnesium_polylepis.1